MKHVNSLRDFTHPVTEAARSSEDVAWQRGYAAGQREALSHEMLALSQQRRDLQQRLVSSIEATSRADASARQAAVEEAAALLSAVAQVLLPRLIEDMFPQILNDCLHEALARSASNKPLLHVHPSDGDAASELLLAENMPQIELVPDAALQPGSCQLNLGHTVQHISPDRLSAELLSRLQSALSLHLKDATHG